MPSKENHKQALIELEQLCESIPDGVDTPVEVLEAIPASDENYVEDYRELPKYYRSKRAQRGELNKLRSLIYLGEIGTGDTPQSLYQSGRIKLHPVVISAAMTKFIKEIPTEDLQVQAWRGVQIFDKLLEAADDLLMHGAIEPMEVNRTILTMTHVLEKKTDWLEKYGMKAKVIEPQQTGQAELNSDRMRQIFLEQRGGNK